LRKNTAGSASWVINDEATQSIASANYPPRRPLGLEDGIADLKEKLLPG